MSSIHYLSHPEKLKMLKKSKKEKGTATDPSALQIDLDDLTYGQSIDEDIENVKSLDFWHLTGSNKNQMFEPTFSSSQSAKSYRQRKVQEGISFPNIKTELLNRILSDPYDEVNSAPIMQSDPGNDEDIARLPLINKKDGTKMKYEATKLAHNEELIHELVLKKMREQINVDTIKKMGQTQLKLYIKSIAEEAIKHFKSLKGMLSPKLINTYMHAALEMIRESKTGGVAVPKNAKELKDWSQEERPVVSYEMSELDLANQLQHQTKEAKELRVTIAEIGHQIFQLKKQKAINADKLKVLQKEYTEIIKGSDPSASPSGRYVQRRIAVSTPSLVKDHMQIKKLKDENKHEENIVLKALAEIEERMAILEAELRLSERSLQATKTKKAYCKMQLKKLFYNILKDEDALLRGNDNNNSKSYCWVVRALWNLGEDVKEDSFPTFMDSKNIEFFMMYARAQEELETYCKMNNITSFLNNIRGFKPLLHIMHHKNDRVNYTKGQPDSTPTEPAGSMPELELYDSAKIATKSLNVLISEYQEKALDLKRINLKAKRPVEGTKYAKDKTGSPKWEEVDPNNLNFDKLPMNHRINLLQDEDRKSSLLKGMAGRPIEKAMELLTKIENMKMDGVERLTRLYMTKALDERSKVELNKLFRFLFGKDEGDQFFFRLVTDKKFTEEKIGATIKKIKTKSSPSDSLLPIKLAKTASEPKSRSSTLSTVNTRLGAEITSSKFKPSPLF